MPTLATLPDNDRASATFGTAKNQARIGVARIEAGDLEVGRNMLRMAHMSLVRALFLNTHRGPISVE
jgi:hypothetical protein